MYNMITTGYNPAYNLGVDIMKILKDLGMELMPSGKKRHYYICACEDCGCDVKVRIDFLKSTKTCMKCRNIRGGVRRTTHNMSRTRQYKIWSHMWDRCTNPNVEYYEFYKDKLPPNEWRDFTVFWNDMKDGYRDDLTIDREDNNLPYSKSNCRWVTRAVQVMNTRVIRSTNTTGFKGVTKKPNGKFLAQIHVNKKHINLGRYKTALEAGIAYNEYVISNGLAHSINDIRSA